MKNPQNRELMSKLYRLVEKYEELPANMSYDECSEYFGNMINELSLFSGEFKCPLGMRMAVALVEAREDDWKAEKAAKETIA